MPRLNSTHVSDAEYEAETESLEITFTSGHKYRYHGVPEVMFDELIEAEEPGHYFRTLIRGSFNYERIE